VTSRCVAGGFVTNDSEKLRLYASILHAHTILLRLYRPPEHVLPSMNMTLLTSYSLIRTADLTFTAFKSADLITITAKCLIKSKARDNDSIRSSFHSTVTAPAPGFLHSPLRAVTVPPIYTLHTHIRVPELISHGAFSRVTSDSKRRLQDNVRCFRDSASET